MAKADPKQIDALAKIETAGDVAKAADYWTEFFSEEALKKMRPPPKGKPGEEGDTKAPMSDGEIDDLMKDVKSLEDELAEAIAKKVKKSTIESREGFYWTNRYDKYYDKHKIVREIRHGRGDRVVEFEESTKQVTNYLIKDLRRMLEERRRRYYVGGHKTGKLNARSLFKARLGDPHIFKKKNQVRDVNAAVSLLIDMSGSMSGQKIRVAMQSAYAFAMVLTQLKVPFEVFGFVTEDGNSEMTKEYRDFIRKHPEVADKTVNAFSPERIYAFKEFGENFDIISKKGMSGAGNSGVTMIQNEDSKHVKLALTRLSARPERVKALFVFSDGMPAFHSHAGTGGSCNNLKYYGLNAKARYGVDIYSIGILSDSVSRFYPNYKVVNKIEELPNALFEFLRKIF
jgi:cobalamin biosynthesis protein CobT